MEQQINFFDFNQRAYLSVTRPCCMLLPQTGCTHQYGSGRIRGHETSLHKCQLCLNQFDLSPQVPAAALQRIRWVLLVLDWFVVEAATDSRTRDVSPQVPAAALQRIRWVLPTNRRRHCRDSSCKQTGFGVRHGQESAR